MITPIRLPDQTKEVHDMAFEADVQEGKGEFGANDWYSTQRFAQEAGVETETVHQWIARGKVTSSRNTRGDVVICPYDLFDVPKPTAFKGEERTRWNGTITEKTRSILKKHSLGNNESFTVEMAILLLLGLMGKIHSKRYYLLLKNYCQRHEALVEVIQTNTKALLEEVNKW